MATLICGHRPDGWVALVRLDRAVAHRDPPRQRRGQLAVVGDDHDRAALGVQLAQQLHHRAAGPGVEVAGRFVGQHDRGSVDDGAGDRDALALAAGHLAGHVRQALPEADTTECLGGGVASVGQRLAAVEQTVGDVVDARHPVEEEERLEHEADQVRTHSGQLAVAHRRRVDAGDADDAARRPIERADDVQQGRLARAGRADDRRQLTVANRERHGVERAHRRLARVLLDDVDQLERQVRRASTGHDGTTTSRSAFRSPSTCTKPLVNRPGVTPTSVVWLVPSGFAPVTTWTA